MRLLTNDLYEGAWLLSKGMELADLWISENACPPGVWRRKQFIVFEFEGDSIDGLKEEYTKGKAEANVLKLKRSMNELKDKMFVLLRDKRLRGGEYEIHRSGASRA